MTKLDDGDESPKRICFPFIYTIYTDVNVHPTQQTQETETVYYQLSWIKYTQMK